MNIWHFSLLLKEHLTFLITVTKTSDISTLFFLNPVYTTGTQDWKEQIDIITATWTSCSCFFMHFLYSLLHRQLCFTESSCEEIKQSHQFPMKKKVTWEDFQIQCTWRKFSKFSTENNCPNSIYKSSCEIDIGEWSVHKNFIWNFCVFFKHACNC